MANNNNAKWVSVAALVCAVIVIAVTWCTWGSVDTAFIGQTDYNGLKFVSDDLWKDIGGSERYAAEVALILGVLALICEAAALYKPTVHKYTGCVTAVLLLVAFIYDCLFVAWNPMDGALLSTYSVGYGAYLSLAFALIGLVCGAAEAYLGSKTAN